MAVSFTQKILTPAQAQKKLAALKRAGKKVVFTNGCFDLLHVGHVTYLEKARRLGDALIVALNSDASVQKLKGPGRPINILKDRLRVIAALGSVDFVTSFSAETPARLIQSLDPSVLVKGGDYDKGSIVGGDWVKSRGGKVCTIPFVAGKSTTGILKKAR